MLVFLLILHILFAFFLILFILLNKGRGSEVGALSSGDEILSSKGSSGFLNKLIIVLAVLSVLTNLSINFVAKNKFSSNDKPIIDVSEYDK